MRFIIPLGLLSSRLRIFLAVFLALLIVFSLSAEHRASPLNILIIHSYNEHIPWNKAFTRG
ncbi:hypothetical protein, partial [Oleiphilus sp. HI0079]